MGRAFLRRIGGEGRPRPGGVLRERDTTLHPWPVDDGRLPCVRARRGVRLGRSRPSREERRFPHPRLLLSPLNPLKGEATLHAVERFLPQDGKPQEGNTNGYKYRTHLYGLPDPWCDRDDDRIWRPVHRRIPHHRLDGVTTPPASYCPMTIPSYVYRPCEPSGRQLRVHNQNLQSTQYIWELIPFSLLR